MKKIRLLLFILFVSLISCSAPIRHSTINLDPIRICMQKTYGLNETVSEKTLRAATRAVAYWNSVLGCQVFRYQKERPTIQFRETEKIPTSDDVLEPFYRKTTRRVIAIIRKTYVTTTKCVRRAIIYISKSELDKFNEWKTETVYRHELGHALGLMDISYQSFPSLMSPLQDHEKDHPIDANLEDIEALRKIHCGE